MIFNETVQGMLEAAKAEERARIGEWAEDFKSKADGQEDEIHIGMVIALGRLLEFLKDEH